MYINIRQQELATCKRIGYKFYCEELFVVRYKSIHSCKSAIYFDLDKDIISVIVILCSIITRQTDITLTVLDGGNEIILVNWPNDKHIICTINNDKPIEIPSHPYVLVNRSVLCNHDIEADNNFLLESLAVCHVANMNLIMYFMVNTTFTNYLDQFKLTEDLEFLVLTNKTTSEFTLPVFLNKSKFNESLLTAPQTLKNYIAQYKQEKEFFYLKEGHDIDELEIEIPNKNFFTNNFIIDIFIFIFIIAIILVITTRIIIIYTLCKHNKLRTSVASLALQQVIELSVAETKEEEYRCKCTSQFYVVLTLSITIIGLVIFTISDVQNYIPVKLYKTAGSTQLLKITGTLPQDKVKLNKHYIWDI